MTNLPALRPNQFHLSSHDLQITYSSDFDGVPFLIYQDTSHSQTFKGSQVTVTSTPFGEIVTANIRVTVNSGTTLFSVMLPNVTVHARDVLVPVRTFGVTTLARRFPFLPLPVNGQIDSYSVLQLCGTAANVTTPL